MDKPRHIDDLADELIIDILSYLLGSAEERQPWNEYASRPPAQASSSSPSAVCGTPDPIHGEKSDLDRFRLVCKRFMRIGTPQQFQRVVLRFSGEGFQRLEDFLGMQQLACHVRYFTYMVRPFYQGSGWPLLLNGVDSHDRLPGSPLHNRRFREQSFLTSTGRDAQLLRRAVAAFSSLQQVKLLRLQDAADEQLLDYLRDRSLEQTACLNWELACTRAVTSLGAALLASDCSSIQFIAPQISPEATVRLLQTPSETLSAIAMRLTSLDVSFHSSSSSSSSTTGIITASMQTLSPVFQGFFLAARNLITIHLGFPPKTPLDLPLEQIFHDVQWKRLRTLSIQNWLLSADDLIAFVRRHARLLRDLRLRNIYLRDGGRWRDVLAVLREEMDSLERLDLRDIDYATDFDAADDDTIPIITNGTDTNGNHNHNNHDIEALEHHPQAHSQSSSLTDDIRRLLSPAQNENTPSTRRSQLSSPLRDRLRALTVDDLGDDGVRVKREQRVLWEAWVLAGSRYKM